MRLLSLDCTQVGHWTAPLQLRFSPRLTVVLGDNEAGKSTLRRAIRALLFGPDKALVAPLMVGGFDMGATLELDAATVPIHRKGRNLQTALPGGLAALLSNANAGRFASLFDLTHENLWPQDQAFLKADGALGSLMFGARTGVSPAQLQQARQHTDQALADTDSRRKGHKGIPFHQDQFLEAKERHQKLARFGENDTLSERHQALDASVKRLDAKLGQLESESGRLKGLIAGAAEVEQLARDRQSRDALIADGSPPSMTRLTEFSQRLSRVEELAEQLRAKRDALRDAAAELDAAEASGELHTLVAQCDALREIVASHTADTQVFEEERERHAKQRADLVQVLEKMGVAGGEDPVAAARGLLRPEPLAAQLRALVNEHRELRNALQQKQGLLAAARRTLEGVAAEVDDTVGTTVDLLDAALPHLEQACNADREIARLAKAQTDAAPALQRQLAVLGLADSANPDALRLPSHDSARQAEKVLADARQHLESARSESARLEGELSSLEAQLAEGRLQIGSVASAEDLAQARALRDARLAALCEGLNATGGTAPTLPALAAQAGDLRALVRQTDLLVDRRIEAGEALGELRAAEQQAAQLSRQCDVAKGKAETASRAESQAQKAVAALWPFLPQPPISTAAWFAQYDAWRSACEAQQQCEHDLVQWRDTLSVTRRDALAILGGTMPQLEALGSAQALHDEVSRERNARSVRASRIEALRKQRLDAQAAFADAEAASQAAEAALAAWKQQWNTSTRELPDGLERQPAAVESWLALQDALRRALGEVDSLTAAMTARSKVMAGKQERIIALVKAAIALAPELPLTNGPEPAAAFALVDAACKASATRFACREALARDRDKVAREMTSAASVHEAEQSALLKDWADAGISEACTREALEAIRERAGEVEKLSRQVAHAEAGLRGRWGDDVPAAIAEIASGGVAALEARLADIESERDQARGDRDDAANARRDAERALEAMQQGRDATTVAQELADAREALLDKVEEHYRLLIAKLILDQAHREASDGGQGIEHVASGYFRTLTGGAYSGLRISDEGPGTPTLVAVESARNEKSLDDLSAGTRDQIWLALRLAGIVAAAKETPFPLLLDDSLVQFDDTRAKAALQLLHRISEQVQVILFTHHDHVADLAREVVPAGDLALVVLPEVSGAMRQRTSKKTSPSRHGRPVMAAPIQARSSSWVVGDDTLGEDADMMEAQQPGRERGAVDVEDAKRAILGVLEAASEPLGKSAILDAVSENGLLIVSAWQEAINSLLSEEQVAREGEKRGTKYRLTQVLAG